MTKSQIDNVNIKVEEGQLYYYPGIKATQKLTAALITENHNYIYPIVDDIILLKKETAMTSMGRTRNPHARVSDPMINEFFDTYKLLKKRKISQPSLKEPKSKPLSNDQLAKLKGLLPKEGDCFMSEVTHDVGALHNLVYNSKFHLYLHLDFSVERLQAIKSDIKKGTMLVLCDNYNLPFIDDAIDSLFSFDYINEYEKESQKAAYKELKRIMKGEGVSVVLYDENRPHYANTQLKVDKVSKKLLNFLSPWKKRKLPTIYFYPIRNKGKNDKEEIYTETSLDSQFS